MRTCVLCPLRSLAVLERLGLSFDVPLHLSALRFTVLLLAAGACATAKVPRQYSRRLPGA
jgi:hypothetical protein